MSSKSWHTLVNIQIESKSLLKFHVDFSESFMQIAILSLSIELVLIKSGIAIKILNRVLFITALLVCHINVIDKRLPINITNKRQKAIIFDLFFCNDKVSFFFCSIWVLNGSELNENGLRVVAVCQKNDITDIEHFAVSDEKNMILLGFIGFLDPPKESAKESIEKLNHAGIRVIVLTGDNAEVTRCICNKVGINSKNIVLRK